MKRGCSDRDRLAHRHAAVMVLQLAEVVAQLAGHLEDLLDRLFLEDRARALVEDLVDARDVKIHPLRDVQLCHRHQSILHPPRRPCTGRLAPSRSNPTELA